MMKFLAMLACTVLLAGCPATTCSEYKPASDAIAAGFANLAQCSNLAAVQAAFYAKMCSTFGCTQGNGWKVSKAPKGANLGGPISDIVCPIAVGFIVGELGGQIPATWGCSLQNVEAFTVSMCEMIPY